MLRYKLLLKPAWSILAVIFLFTGIATLIMTGPDKIWGWLLLIACWWCFRKFAE